MIVYPAVDIRDGRAVRLIEGNFDREIAYDADPVESALRWVAAGTEWIHIVDLDGSVAGRPVNLEAIARIRAAIPTTVHVQLGGGLRTEKHVADVFDLGVDRCILGTAVLERPEVINVVVERWSGRFAVSLDARDGKLALGGWKTQTDVAASELAVELQAAGVTMFIFTDIRRDGTLTGPNVPAIQELIGTLAAAAERHDRSDRAAVISAGGVGNIADVEAVAAAGAEGLIIGRALYDGRVTLTEALRVASEGVRDAAPASVERSDSRMER